MGFFVFFGNSFLLFFLSLSLESVFELNRHTTRTKIRGSVVSLSFIFASSAGEDNKKKNMKKKKKWSVHASSKSFFFLLLSKS